MKEKQLTWQVGYSDSIENEPKELYPASVPGSVQMDYAKAKGLPPFYKGVNFREYKWMEDVFWHYYAKLDFSVSENEIATLVFKGIDYKYKIIANGKTLAEDEGMFSYVKLDVTEFSGVDTTLEVIIYPAPKCDDSDCRDQARKSVKACACYGWDWHPRLISAGLWDTVTLLIENKQSIKDFDIAYSLSDDLKKCVIDTELALNSDADVIIKLLDGDTVVAETAATANGAYVKSKLEIADPKLWYPVGYGDQHSYTLEATVIGQKGEITDVKTRKIGFRRSKLVMNEGAWKRPSGFPKSRSDAPATLEINGRRIFAKGSNWVNAEVFPGDMTAEKYDELLEIVKNANMNILRIWGGGFVNKESFFELCDEKGIMVWQEFPLACNLYPDEDGYLDVLKKEATAIIKRLRSHPSVVLWCGGNELFNSWSGMTDQSHPLRLLDSLCYEYDRFTPFIMTSPLNGMGHGSYINYSEKTGSEFITEVVNSNNTAYTEFGAPGASNLDVILDFMEEKDFDDFRPENDVWREHHAFKAWTTNTWMRPDEADYYFGGYEDMRDLIKKTQFIQAMCYRSLFEEMRKQWPACSMALNWCFNEPWPTAANNSLICWPTKLKPAYFTVKEALRASLASLRVTKHLWWEKQTFNAEIWMLNDSSIFSLPAGKINVSYALGDAAPQKWGTLDYAEINEQTNLQCGCIAFKLPEGFEGEIHVYLNVEGSPELDSEYTYLCRAKKKKAKMVKILNM